MSALWFCLITSELTPEGGTWQIGEMRNVVLKMLVEDCRMY